MTTTLLAVPNVSEGRDPAAIEAIGAAFASRLLDVHSDPDHHRSVFTLAGAPGELAAVVAGGAREALRRIDVSGHEGAHPRVGAIDVAPIVYLDRRRPRRRLRRGARARRPARRAARAAGVPVRRARRRAHARRAAPRWPAALAARIESGELRPDFGPRRLHPTAGAVLVAARPPLVAFNVELAPPATLEDAKAIAARIREGGPEGLPALRAIGLWLADRGVAQVSTNVEDHRRTPLADVVEAIARHAAPARAELVGLAPRAAFDGFPERPPGRQRGD